MHFFIPEEVEEKKKSHKYLFDGIVAMDGGYSMRLLLLQYIQSNRNWMFHRISFEQYLYVYKMTTFIWHRWSNEIGVFLLHTKSVLLWQFKIETLWTHSTETLHRVFLFFSKNIAWDHLQLVCAEQRMSASKKPSISKGFVLRIMENLSEVVVFARGKWWFQTCFLQFSIFRVIFRPCIAF